jgi:hypothetical protein
MILALGVWTFLRALLGRCTAVTLENIALRHAPGGWLPYPVHLNESEPDEHRMGA